MAKVYFEFKEYVNKHNDSLEKLLEDMLRYSKFYKNYLMVKVVSIIET